MSIRDLKAELWNCAQILRGSAVARTDWKAYILPLPFFKRISDVWDEENLSSLECSPRPKFHGAVVIAA